MMYHPNWPFLRSGGVIYVVEKLREYGISPVRIKTESLPERIRDQGYNNFAKTTNTFHACYCHAQGYLRTSDIARLVLVYLHLGKGVFKQKPCSTIPILHKKVQTGLHRFTSIDKIEKHWGELLHLVMHDKYPFDKYFDDRGKATAPLKYLVAVEKGLRSFAQDKYAMGTHANDSAESYHAVKLWRKREAYIAVCRYLKGAQGYLKYIGYACSDYQMRLTMQKTFDERHAQYTNGTKKLRGLSDPESWSAEPAGPAVTKKLRRKSKHVSTPPSAAATSNGNGDDEYIYDSEEDTWVKVE